MASNNDALKFTMMSGDPLVGRINHNVLERESINRELKRYGPTLIECFMTQKGHEMSLRRLAMKIGKSPSYVCHIRNGRMVISPKLYVELVEMLREQHKKDAGTPSVPPWSK